jgi:hypothetical protein
MKSFKQILKEREEELLDPDRWVGTAKHNTVSSHYIGHDSVNPNHWYNKQHGPGSSYDIPKSITPEEAESLNDYAWGSWHINHFHRSGGEVPKHFSGTKGEIEHHTKNLDSVLNKHSLSNNFHVWRGFAEHKIVPALNLKPGDTFHDKGFVSTSTNPNVAKGFTPLSPGIDRHLFHIKVPKGSKALAMEHVSFGAGGENEVLLPRNSKFRYDSREEHPAPEGSKLIIHHVTHIPESSE